MSTTTPSQTSNEPMNIDLGGAELKVIYKPNIGKNLKEFLENNFEPSMGSYDGSSHQYEPTDIADFIKDNPDRAKTLTEQDMAIVEALVSHYDYLEI